MRFYPLGSSSLNTTYNTSSFTTASVAQYAQSASFAIRTVTASYALQGVNGINGADGVCDYQPGPSGSDGPIGFGGNTGGVSVVYPSGSGY